VWALRGRGVMRTGMKMIRMTRTKMSGIQICTASPFACACFIVCPRWIPQKIELARPTHNRRAARWDVARALEPCSHVHGRGAGGTRANDARRIAERCGVRARTRELDHN
jgi:hypothetical protein